MDYTREKTTKIKKEIHSKKKKAKNKAGVLALRIFMIAAVVLCFAAVGGATGAYFGIIQGAPKLESVKVLPNIYTSLIYDCYGNEIDRLKSEENREYVTAAQIPQYLKDAFVAIEDERYYQHDGVDFQGFARAIFVLFTEGRNEGASTITQQLIKNSITKVTRNTITTKLQEQYLALQYEKMLLEERGSKKAAKDYILEVYLNTISLGHNLNGVQTAAYYYFDKDVSELTLSECSVIAAITQNPTKYSPVNRPEDNKKRRDTVLRYMLIQGYITESEYQEALADDVYSRISESEQLTAFQNSYHSYFTDQVLKQVSKDLAETYTITAAEAYYMIYNGGLQIYTTQDMSIQKIMDDSFSNDEFFPTRDYKIDIEYYLSVKNTITDKLSHYQRNGSVKSEDEIEAWIDSVRNELVKTNDEIIAERYIPIPQPQAAMVIMDFHNGQVKGVVGGRGEKMLDLGLNRATASERQPGSVFKILASYAPALDLGLISPSTVIVDEPYTVEEYNYTPNNWYGGFRGPSSIRDGIRNSMNVITVRNMVDTGIDACFDYLLNFGFTTLVTETQLINGQYKTDRGPAACLGGLTYGVTQLELCAAYSAIANDGEYIEPIFYTKVLDHDGRPLLENNPEPRRVLKQTTSYMLTDMMKEVITNGTGGRAAFKNTSMPLAGKTGTATDTKDLMFTGYTPYYAASIWMGFDQPQTISQDEGFHLRLWSDIMEKIHADLPVKQFEVPEGVTTAQVCRDSGKLSIAGLCDSDLRGSRVVTDMFMLGMQPTDTCDMHVAVDIDSVSYKPFNPGVCPAENKETLIGVINSAPDAILSPDSAWSIPESFLTSEKCNDHAGGGTAQFGPVIPNQDVFIPGSATQSNDNGDYSDYNNIVVPVSDHVYIITPAETTPSPDTQENTGVQENSANDAADGRQTPLPVTPMPAAATEAPFTFYQNEPEPTAEPDYFYAP